MTTLLIPKFRLPGIVAQLGRHLPQWPHALALVSALNTALRFKLLPESELTALEGRHFLIRVLDTGGEARFCFSQGRFRPLFSNTGAADLQFAANLSAYLQLLTRQEDPDTLFFNRELDITGDTELGLMVKNMLDAVDWPRLPSGLLPGAH
ncbi:MAG: SCP2 sterol-binding domain-containing protein [Dechloromonas sp.]|nr:SCP2 sterol-binding domain-containing protein [Dechloromonas sp.]